MAYPKEIKESILSMLYSPNAPSLRELSRRHGVPKATIQSWVTREEQTAMSLKNPSNKKANYWPPSEKLDAVVKSMTLDEEKFGLYLRENGLYSSLVTQWKEDMLRMLSGITKHQTGSMAPSTEITVLKRELREKEKALAELSALVILKKKASRIWGDDEDEKPTS